MSTFNVRAIVCDWHDIAVDSADAVRERSIKCETRISIKPIKAIAKFDWEVSLGDEMTPTHRAVCRVSGSCMPTTRDFLFVLHRLRPAWYRILSIEVSDNERTAVLVLSLVSENSKKGDPVPSPKRGKKYGVR